VPVGVGGGEFIVMIFEGGRAPFYSFRSRG